MLAISKRRMETTIGEGMMKIIKVGCPIFEVPAFGTGESFIVNVGVCESESENDGVMFQIGNRGGWVISFDELLEITTYAAAMREKQIYIDHKPQAKNMKDLVMHPILVGRPPPILHNAN